MSIHIDAQQLEQIIKSRMGHEVNEVNNDCCSILSIVCLKLIHTEPQMGSFQLFEFTSRYPFRLDIAIEILFIDLLIPTTVNYYQTLDTTRSESHFITLLITT